MKNGIRPPGLIEIPGMKGTISVEYDLTRGDVRVQAGPVALPNVAQVLLFALLGTIQKWAGIEARLIKPAQETTDGSEEKDPD